MTFWTNNSRTEELKNMIEIERLIAWSKSADAFNGWTGRWLHIWLRRRHDREAGICRAD